MEVFNIGDILIRWDSPDYRLRGGQYAPLFRHEGSWNGESLTFRASVCPLEPYTAFPKVGESALYEIYDVGGERLHLYHWSYCRYGYAVWPDRVSQGREDVCLFDPDMKTQLPPDFDWFFGVCGLHKGLLHYGRAVFHAAYINHAGKALLFAAPSETGKSTQAELWRQHAGARIVNGDRALLGIRDGIWYAHGYPACGSSDICLNESSPVQAIIVLEQGTQNRVSAMTQAQKLRALVSGMAVYAWDIEEIDRAFSLAEKICESVPMIRLSCLPNEEAVDVLRVYLEELEHVHS